MNSHFRHAGLEETAPYLIRGHPEGLGRAGFRREFIPMKIGAGMTIRIEAAMCKQTLNERA